MPESALNHSLTRIYVCPRISDTRAKSLKNKLINLGFQIQSLEIIDSYIIEAELASALIKENASILVNPIKEQFFDNTIVNFDYAIEIGFLPGVTDNIATTAQNSLLDHIKSPIQLKVYSSQIFLLKTVMSAEAIKELTSHLYNPLIQRVRIKTHQEFLQDNGMGVDIPKVQLCHKIEASEVNLNIPDSELEAIGREGILNTDGTRRGPLALGLDYMKAIQSYFSNLKRKPRDIELESIAQTWSEHCKHTIFADPIDDIQEGLYKGYIKAATNTIRKNKGKKDFCVSVFTDNSGAIIFDDKHLITHKVETHNSPSVLDPFGGSITGIVGVNRDAIGCGLGAKPIANVYGYCFGDPDDTNTLYRDQNLTQPVLSPKRIMEGVIEGVKVGGNHSGIATVHGFSYFHESYKAKPLVFVGTIGLMPKTIQGKDSCIKQALAGDYIVMLGGRVGLDGIHGATFSSVEMNSGSPATAVQIGDPITQKKLSDAIIKEARDRGLYNSITDNGAGGISCSVAEMARESNGCKVQLDKVPLKYPGMQAWEIWISESQERMTLAIAPEKWEEFHALMKSRDVEATIIGEFTDSGQCQVSYHDEVIMDIELEFLHNGLPRRQLKTKKSPNITKPSTNNPAQALDLKTQLLEKISSLNHCSQEFISQQYDHEVQGISVIKPLQGQGRVNGDIAVIRPVLTSNKGVILSYGLCPEYTDINAYDMAANAIDMAVRSAIATGADLNKIAILDNFCWCSSNEPERLYQLKEAARACYDYAVAYGTPFISGKDSMFNDFKGYDASASSIKISALPTLLISAISVIDDHRKVISMDFKIPEDLIYVLGSSTVSTTVDAESNLALYQNLQTAIEQNLVTSSISINRGGLAIALTRSSISGQLGLDVDYKSDDLFTESSGQILISIDPNKKLEFEACFSKNQINNIGKVKDNKDNIIIREDNNIILELSTKEALKAYRSRFASYLYETENKNLAEVN